MPNDQIDSVDKDAQNTEALPESTENQTIDWHAERRHLYEVAAMVDSMQRRGEDQFEAVMREITATTVESVPGAQYACVTTVDNNHTVSSLAATHQYPIMLDDVHVPGDALLGEQLAESLGVQRTTARDRAEAMMIAAFKVDGVEV